MTFKCNTCRDQGFIHDGTYDIMGERNTKYCPDCETSPAGCGLRPDSLEGLLRREEALTKQLNEIKELITLKLLKLKVNK